MDYDVVILGGGLTGCAVAAQLAQYNLNIAVIERNFDVAEDVAPLISTFVTDGVDLVSDEAYKLLAEGQPSLEAWSKRANFHYRREPSFSIYEDQRDYEAALERISRRKIPGAGPISLKEALKQSQHVPKDAAGIIYHENTGIVSPYDMATALGEIAFENGVRFRLEEEVTNIERLSHDEVRVTTDKSKYLCRVVVITAFNDLYLGKGVYRKASRDIPLHTMLLEKRFEDDVRRMMKIHHKDDLLSVIMPTFGGKTVSAVESREPLDYKGVKTAVENLIGPFPADRVDLLTVNRYFDDPVQIFDELKTKGYINLEVKSHHLPVLLASINRIIGDLVVANFKAVKNPDVVTKRRSYFRFKDMTDEERNEAIQLDPRFGKMICTCSQVTEGEIVNTIRRPLGARTVEGVKRRTGIVFGSCQGAYCMTPVLKILAREMDKKPEEIMNDRRHSRVLKARIKEFEDI